MSPSNEKAAVEADKAAAKAFLQSLEAYVNQLLPAPGTMATEVAAIVRRNRLPGGKKHLASPEAAVLNSYVAPNVFGFLERTIGRADDARRAFLCESARHFPQWASGTPARRIPGHPFSKAVGRKPTTIMAQWTGQKSGSPLTQSCPDFAFRRPAPHTVVFKVKYFGEGSLAKAESALAMGSYEAFFYRALPRILESESAKRPSWDYEYGGLVICDTSARGNVGRAWERIPAAVRDGWWEGANIYVMLLRGPDAAP